MQSSKRKFVITSLAAAMTIGFTPASHALFGVGDIVFDPTAVMNLVKQLSEMAKQYQAIVTQIQQAERAYNSITGIRSVGGLFMALNDRLVYNSLPPEAQLLVKDTRGLMGQFSELSRRIEDAQRETTALTNGSFKDINSPGAIMWKDAVQRIASQYGTGETLYKGATVRVQKLEDLVRAIGTAGDPKAIADLNARIAGEQALLQNELIKLEALRMVQHAQAAQLTQKQSDAYFMTGKQGIPTVTFPRFGQTN